MHQDNEVKKGIWLQGTGTNSPLCFQQHPETPVWPREPQRGLTLNQTHPAQTSQTAASLSQSRLVAGAAFEACHTSEQRSDSASRAARNSSTAQQSLKAAGKAAPESPRAGWELCQPEEGWAWPKQGPSAVSAVPSTRSRGAQGKVRVWVLGRGPALIPPHPADERSLWPCHSCSCAHPTCDRVGGGGNLNPPELGHRALPGATHRLHMSPVTCAVTPRPSRAARSSQEPRRSPLNKTENREAAPEEMCRLGPGQEQSWPSHEQRFPHFEAK